LATAAGAKGIRIEKQDWSFISDKGHALGVTHKGTRVIESIGEVLIEELPEVCAMHEAAVFRGRGAWRDQSYAWWESRVDDGRDYVYHADQVTHAGNDLTWTAHVNWLPPAFFFPAHVNLQVVLSPGAFSSVRTDGNTLSLEDLDSKGQTLGMEKTGIYQEFRLVLEGPAGPIVLRTAGLEQMVRSSKAREQIRLTFREYAPDPVTVPKDRRARGYWIRDPKVHRISIVLSTKTKPVPEIPAERLAFKPDKPVNPFPAVGPDVISPAGPVRTKWTGKGRAVAWEDLKGARAKSPDGCWEVGWRYVPRERDLRLPDVLRRVQGIWIGEYGQEDFVPVFRGKHFEPMKVSTSTGSRILRADEMTPAGDALKLPRLAVLGDVEVIHCRDHVSPDRYFDEDGKVVQENMLYSKPMWKGEWFYVKPDIKYRREKLAYAKGAAFLLRRTYLDSTALDTNGDGLWNPKSGAIMEATSFRLKMHLGWFVAVPATWFDMPADAGNELRFKYQSKDGVKEAAIALNPFLYPRKGNVRIGVIGRWGRLNTLARSRHDDGFYVVQSADEPGALPRERGRIIAKIGDSAYPDRLAILEGTLRVQPGGEWQPPDPVPSTGRRWFSPQNFRGGLLHNPNAVLWWSEHTHWENARYGDWNYRKINVYGGIYHNVTTYEDPVMNLFNRPVRMNPKPVWQATALRYGTWMGIYRDCCGLPVHSSIPEEYLGESMDPRSGKFYKIRSLDYANPEARAWLREEWRKALLPFKGVTAFVGSGEMKSRLYVGYHEPANPLWSRAALESFRGYVGDPSARLPTDSCVAETERTTNEVSDELWEKYIKWSRHIFSQHCLMLYEGAYQALNGDPFYLGGQWFGAGDYVSEGQPPYCRPMEAEAVLKSPALGVFIYEYPVGYETDKFKHTRDLARKYGKRIQPLFGFWDADANDTAFGTIAETLEDFKPWALDCDHDGIIICGFMPMQENGQLWLALVRKHYGKGTMSLERAEEIIRESRVKAEAERKKPKEEKRASIPLGKRAMRIEARRVEGVSVDGDLGEWKDVAGRKVERFLKNSIDQVRAAGWRGERDLSGCVRLAYDDHALYLGIDIKDDAIFTRDRVEATPLSRNLMGIEGDQIEVFFARPPDFRVTGEPVPVRRGGDSGQMEPDESLRIQHVIVPGRKQVHRHSAVHTELEPLRDTACATQLSRDGYVVEARLPWSVLQGRATKGQSIAFDLMVKDRDGPHGGLEPMLMAFCSDRRKPWYYLRDWATATLN